MSTSKIIVLINVILLHFAGSCNGQTDGRTKAQGDAAHTPATESFENSSFTYLGIPERIYATDTSLGWKQDGQKMLLTGKIYQRDGKTPAANVLLYYYHTNTAGHYVHKPGEPQSMPPNNLGQTHGSIRGWIKTNATGNYSIYTVRPGSYPMTDEPAHIHLTIKEPNTFDEYYIDDVVFDDDKTLTSKKRQRFENRGGSGIVRLVKKDDLHIAERDIVLGLNIPNHPATPSSGFNSGHDIGEPVFSFIPMHAWGADKGTKTCPVCKYGWYHGILYFVGNKPNWKEIKSWLNFLESQSITRDKHLKVYFVYGNEANYDPEIRKKELEKIGTELQLRKVALTFVPSFSDSKSEVDLNAINQSVENTFILYKRSTIIDKFINLKPTAKNFDTIAKRLDETINQYFILPPGKDN